MQELKPTYYFNDLQNDFLLPILFDGIDLIYEVYAKKNIFLESNIKKNISASVHPTAIINGEVEIGQGSVVGPYVVIDGPAIVGKNCYIRPHSYIRSHCVISDNVVIGHGVEVKNSLIFSDCKIDSGSFVGDSIFGRGVRNGSGTMTANRRFDQGEICIKVKGQKFETHEDKFGCIVGDYTRIGANSTVLPGTLIGQHVWIYPQTLVHGFIEIDNYLKRNEDIIKKERVLLKSVDKNGMV